jgi:hypothetical protein
MDHHGEPELDAVAARLRADRPELSPLELDQLQLRIRSQSSTSRRNPLMKSRLVVTLMLVFGIGLSSAGAGLAVSGQSGGGNAAEAQYPANDAPAASDVLGEVGTVEEEQAPAPAPEQAPAPQAQPQAAAAPAPVQQEVTDEGGSLPFTGFASGSVLLLGLMLLASGLVMRHRLRDER